MKLLETYNYSEKRSKFIVYLFEITSAEEFKNAYQTVQDENKKARHVLRAGCYQNHFGIYITEASEDKEPIASMKKVASLMEKNDIKDRGVFIVRYFGGVKFGASYLDKVYTELGMKLLKKP